MAFSESLIKGFLFLVTFIYDVITFPIYFIVQKPWKIIRDFKDKKVSVSLLVGSLNYLLDILLCSVVSKIVKVEKQCSFALFIHV